MLAVARRPLMVCLTASRRQPQDLKVQQACMLDSVSLSWALSHTVDSSLVPSTPLLVSTLTGMTVASSALCLLSLPHNQPSLLELPSLTHLIPCADACKCRPRSRGRNTF